MMDSGSIRWRWLKAMYLYTIFGAGGFGLAFILFPRTVQASLRMPAQDAFIFGLYGSVLLVMGLLGIPALRSPLKFAPLLLLQLVYKIVWLAAVVLPLALKGQLPFYAAFVAVVFLTYIVGDLIAIPFSYLFAGKAEASSPA